MTVEEALRLLVTGGVIMPPEAKMAGRELSPPVLEIDNADPSAAKIVVPERPSPQALGKTG
jgi:uncharacterized membrane protein